VKLSDLVAETGVPVATVKYYLREGLLPPGRRISATWAEYSPAHVERVRLIRALVDGAGVRIEGVRRVIEAIDRPPASRHDFLGVAQQAIDGSPPDVVVGPVARAAAHRLGWTHCSTEALAHLQAAMDTAERAGFPVTVDRLVGYGGALADVAAIDLDDLAADPRASTPAGALTHVAVGTVVTDGVLVALRRLAQQQESERRYAGAGRSGGGGRPGDGR
jgi:DNA-binding transcriptional MerR regulator